MKQRVVYIPEQGLPKRIVLRDEPDTTVHRWARIALYTGIALLYIIGVGSWLIGKPLIGFRDGFGLAILAAITPFMVHQLVRPGKGIVWLCTLGVILSLMLPGVFLVLLLLPVAILIKKMFCPLGKQW